MRTLKILCLAMLCSSFFSVLSFADEFGTKAFLMRARAEGMKDFGACLSPANAFYILQGIETLPLRMQKHVTNAQAVAEFLETNKSPSRVVNEIDNRGSHFYFAKFWAEAIASQDRDSNLKSEFRTLEKTLNDEESTITRELLEAQGSPMNLGGYYYPDPSLAEKAMRPSPTFNRAVASLKS